MAPRPTGALDRMPIIRRAPFATVHPKTTRPPARFSSVSRLPSHLRERGARLVLLLLTRGGAEPAPAEAPARRPSERTRGAACPLAPCAACPNGLAPCAACPNGLAPCAAAPKPPADAAAA